MRVFLSVMMLIFAVSALAQKSDRRGPNNGTVRQLPSPRLSETRAEIEPPGGLLIDAGQDKDIARIETDYQAAAFDLNLKIQSAPRHDRRKLEQQGMLLKYERDRAILNRMRLLAGERSDAEAIARIDASLLQLQASAERAVAPQAMQPKSEADAAATKQPVPPNGELPQNNRAGGAQ